MYVVRWSTESCNGSADRRKRRQHCHVSEITDYQRAKKSDDHHASLLLTLKRPLLVTGDVIVELFNKPKMMKKVVTDVDIRNIIVMYVLCGTKSRKFTLCGSRNQTCASYSHF